MPEGISNHSHRRRNFRSEDHLSVDNHFPGGQTLGMRLSVLCLLATALACPPCRAQVPVFKATPVQCAIRFNVESSTPVTGNFEKWNATLTFASRDPTSATLDVEIQAASVHSASNSDEKLKGKEFLDAAQDPVISFKSNKVIQTGKTTYDLVGTFTMHGVSKPATLSLVIADQGGGSGYVQGIVPFEIRDYGMAGNRRGDGRGEVDINLKVEQVSGPALIQKKFRQ